MAESGNQQERSVELAFIAGLAVADGCFYLSVENPRKQKLVCPGFRLAMNDHESIEIAAAMLNELGLPFYISHTRNQKVIDVKGLKRIVRFTEALLPYLTGTKKRSAEIVLEYAAERGSKSPKEPYGEIEISCVERIRLNNSAKKGKTTNSPDILRD